MFRELTTANVNKPVQSVLLDRKSHLYTVSPICVSNLVNTLVNKMPCGCQGYFLLSSSNLESTWGKLWQYFSLILLSPVGLQQLPTNRWNLSVVTLNVVFPSVLWYLPKQLRKILSPPSQSFSSQGRFQVCIQLILLSVCIIRMKPLKEFFQETFHKSVAFEMLGPFLWLQKQLTARIAR